MIAASHILVSTVLGESFTASAERELDLGSIVETELAANVPTLLCSVPGYDASSVTTILLQKRGNKSLVSLLVLLKALIKLVMLSVLQLDLEGLFIKVYR